MSDRLLIVGGTGFIGNNLLPFAINLGYKVTNLFRYQYGPVLLPRSKNPEQYFKLSVGQLNQLLNL